jgi:superfamily II DNA or RNA helicase
MTTTRHQRDADLGHPHRQGMEAPVMTIIDGTGGIRLRSYQTECVDTLMRWLHAPRSEDATGEHPHLAIVLPTGAGKTVIFSALGDAWHGRHPGEPILILAHRDELITQPASKYRNVVPDAKIGVIKADRHEVAGREVVITSVQSLNARRRDRLGAWRPSLLVIDEAHHATAKIYRDVIAWAGCPVVGFIAE